MTLRKTFIHEYSKITTRDEEKLLVYLSLEQHEAKWEKCYTPMCGFSEYLELDSPGGAVVKNPPANAGDMGSIPPGRSHTPQSS